MGEIADHYIEGFCGFNPKPSERAYYENLTWVSKDGKVSFIRDMDDNYLKNCKVLLEKKGLTSELEYARLCEEIKRRNSSKELRW